MCERHIKATGKPAWPIMVVLFTKNILLLLSPYLNLAIGAIIYMCTYNNCIDIHLPNLPW